MRMPITEFITHADLKFVIVYVLFSASAVCHAVKKYKTKNKSEGHTLTTHYNAKIDQAAFWILICSILSLLLGLMHSFYFVGHTGGIAPPLMFQGIAYTLITPVMGVGFFMVSKLLRGLFNPKQPKA